MKTASSSQVIIRRFHCSFLFLVFALFTVSLSDASQGMDETQSHPPPLTDDNSTEELLEQRLITPPMTEGTFYSLPHPEPENHLPWPETIDELLPHCPDPHMGSMAHLWNWESTAAEEHLLQLDLPGEGTTFDLLSDFEGTSIIIRVREAESRESLAVMKSNENPGACSYQRRRQKRQT
jgi:hypothetical protein